ncbi:MAG TPA: LLM class F420-dependent oxidoreductase [Acidimicrobiia bacterium]|jgi:probable F420-dependent oxidoreductase|nr:LLM class F420-dependent oxidoreductase [Acidimicrobiia bacterium]
MDWGVHLPHLGRDVGRDSLIGFAQAAEKIGIHSAWASDHVCWPAQFESKYPYSSDGSFPAPSGLGWLDPIGTLLFVAGCTEQIRLGFTVLILPYRQPVATAKQLATIDVVSEGRLILGVGVGWMREEAQVLGMPWDNRGRRSDEQLEIFEALFQEETPSYDGTYYSFPQVRFEPKPIQQPLPVWVGGNSPAAFRRTARFGHAFHAAFEPLDVVEKEWEQVREACEAITRDPDELDLSLRMFLDPSEAMEPAKSIGGSVDQMVDTIGLCQEIGITHILLDPVARGGIDGRLDALADFMSDVASQIK